jgi:hypothetical protein
MPQFTATTSKSTPDILSARLVSYVCTTMLHYSAVLIKAKLPMSVVTFPQSGPVIAKKQSARSGMYLSGKGAQCLCVAVTVAVGYVA